MKRLLFAALCPVALPVAAQQFTTAAEVKPILEATRGSWVSVREFDGKDLVYFTHLLSWRCGMEAVHFTINKEPTVYEFPMEPCHEGTAQPNAIVSEGYQVYAELPLGAVKTLEVAITLDDGTSLIGNFERAAVMTP